MVFSILSDMLEIEKDRVGFVVVCWIQVNNYCGRRMRIISKRWAGFEWGRGGWILSDACRKSTIVMVVCV